MGKLRLCGSALRVFRQGVGQDGCPYLAVLRVHHCSRAYQETLLRDFQWVAGDRLPLGSVTRLQHADTDQQDTPLVGALVKPTDVNGQGNRKEKKEADSQLSVGESIGQQVKHTNLHA
jgi:hypothetical protein